MHLNITIVLCLGLLIWCNARPNVVQDTELDYENLSIELLEAIKHKSETKAIRNKIQSATLDELVTQLNTDDKKLAFWVNIYNAYIQMILELNPDLYNDRRSFFKTPRIPIAGEVLSFEDIEHGIIRRSQNPLGLGYVRRWFRPKYERKLRVNDRDYRVHFALNCGAKSCPPISIYKSESLHEQFDYMTKAFLVKFSFYDESKDELAITSLFSWFRGDFGGKKGIRKILMQNDMLNSDKTKLKYADYDWTIDLGNFVD